jgi:hypothetical protein
MPGQPMMMPGQPMMSMPVVPAGYGVIGVPMSGPGGVPTMVPMLVSMPGAAPAPPPPEAASASSSATARARAKAGQGSDAMRELDRATRRIAATQPSDAVLELTEDVSQSSTRLASEPSESPSSAAASASSLRLDVRSAQDAADRLETLDAVVPEVDARDEPSTADDDAFFPSFAAEPEAEAEPPRVRRGAVALDDDDMETVTRSYHLLRDGVPGPEHPLTTLVAMVQRGDLRATDTLVHPLTQRRLKVIDVAELRVELGRAPMPAASHAIPIAAPVAQRPMMTQPERRSGGTFLWIAIATAAFAAAGAWLWWRANGG